MISFPPPPVLIQPEEIADAVVTFIRDETLAGRVMVWSDGEPWQLVPLDTPFRYRGRKWNPSSTTEEEKVLIRPIETERLIIRQFEPGDWAAVYEYASDPEVMTYIPEGQFTQAQARAFVARNVGEQAEEFAVILKDTGKLIGHMVFHPWFAPRTNEIGWVLHRAYQGRGYATEAALALLDYGFTVLELHRVIATCQPENPPSYRVMEKIGMRREGFFQKCIYRGDDQWWDECFYAILEDEWLRTKGTNGSR